MQVDRLIVIQSFFAPRIGVQGKIEEGTEIYGSAWKRELITLYSELKFYDYRRISTTKN